MSYTFRNLARAALLEIGAIDPVDGLAPEELDLALEVGQLMVESFDLDRLDMYTEKLVSFTCVASQATRTLGVGGDFDTATALGAATPRPSWIGPSRVVPVGDDVDYPLTPYLLREDYYNEPLKTLTDLWPRRFLYEPSWPLGQLTWWPIPTTAAVVKLALAVPFSGTLTPDTVLSMPPGYLEAWKLSLALRCCRPFRRQIDPDLREDARLARGAIRRVNDGGPPPARCDGVGGHGIDYDIRSNRGR